MNQEIIKETNQTELEQIQEEKLQHYFTPFTFENQKLFSNENFQIEEDYYFKHLPRETCLEPEAFIFQEENQMVQGSQKFIKKDTGQDIKKTKNIDWTYLNLNSESQMKFGSNNQEGNKMEISNSPSYGSFGEENMNIDFLTEEFKDEDFGGETQNKNRDFAFGQF